MTWHSYDRIPWQRWTPKDVATLLFVVRDEKILLIHKKRGLGKGKINGPGGRVEAGETPRQCAIREVEEELCVTPVSLRRFGLLDFQFVDGYSLRCHVYRADDCKGTPTETDEAVPLWLDLDAIPYDRMWADDRIWLPMLLAGRDFQGRFLFDGDRMTGFRMLDGVPANPAFAND